MDIVLSQFSLHSYRSFFHLRARNEIPIWYDLIVILSYARTGLICGFISLHDIEKRLSDYMNRNIISGLVVLFLFYEQLWSLSWPFSEMEQLGCSQQSLWSLLGYCGEIHLSYGIYQNMGCYSIDGSIAQLYVLYI